MTLEDKHLTPMYRGIEEIIDIYWDEYGKSKKEPVICGAGVSGSLIDDDFDCWNINNLKTVLDKATDRDGPFLLSLSLSLSQTKYQNIQIVF